MSHLSIIIPALDGHSPPLDATLVSVLENRPAGSRIVLVHSGTYDDPYRLRGEIELIEAERSTDLLGCLNHAVEVCREPVFHVLLPGTLVTPGWAYSPLEGFQATARVASISPLAVCADRTDRVFATGVRLTTAGNRCCHAAGRRADRQSLARQPIVGPTLQAGFYRRETFLEAGGFERSVGPQWADLDLALTLQTLGYDTCFEPESVVTVRPPSRSRRVGFHDARCAERMFWRHAEQVGLFGKLLHPFCIGCEMFGNLPSPAVLTALLGRLSACCCRQPYRRYREFLAQKEDEASCPELLQPPRPWGESAEKPEQTLPATHRRAA